MITQADADLDNVVGLVYMAAFVIDAGESCSTLARRAFSGARRGGRAGRVGRGLTQMTANAGLSVVVVDAAYTSRWGTQHWLAPLREHRPQTTGHHAAALVIGRRGQGYRAGRRATGNRTAPEDAMRPAQARHRKPPVTPAPERKPAAPRGTRQPHGGKTEMPHEITAGNQATQDRPAPPTAQNSLLRSD